MSLSTPAPELAAAVFRSSRRFEILDVLGRGANGIVYRARDRETDQQVALKTLLSPDAEQTYHLKAEFRSLAEITHPNLVQLEELFVSGDDCFFTMELLEGDTFTKTVSAAASDAGSKGPRVWSDAGLASLRGVMRQLVQGISALHAAGKLHRDIKPSNIIVTNDGRAVLVDFGLCTELRLVEHARHHLVGTLVYMAPEQAWGKPLTPAADWYALGAVLFEALTGRLPFEGQGSSLLFAKERPPPVAAVSPMAASALAELAAAMMDPHPARRPDPDAILDALGDDAAAPRSAELVRSSPRPAPFVGRSAEMSVLAAALDDLTRGRPAVVDVEGPSGIGKTTLVERFLGSLSTHRGSVVLRGRCHPQESVSYNGFDGVVDDLSEWLRNVDDSAIAEVLPADVGALQALFPVLGRIPAIARNDEPSEPSEPFALRQRAFRALRELFSKMGELYTVAVAIDDLQWGGADTATLLSEVFRPPNTPRGLLVLAYRGEEQASSQLLNVLRERAGDLLDSIHRISLGPMDRAASCELASQLLGDASPELRSTSERIADEARGHPLYLRELALAAVTPAVDGEEPPSSPPDLPNLLKHRVERLESDERRIIELASAGGRPVPRRVVLAAAGPGERGRHLVSRLTRKRLLRETVLGGETAVEPYHSHVRDAVLGFLSAQERLDCHRSLADVMLRESEPDVDSLVDHLLGAGDLALAGEYAKTAADRADRALAFDRAVHLYRLALELQRGAAHSNLRTRLAAALANTGRSREAAEAYAAAAVDAEVDAPTLRADLARLAAEHYLRAGDLEEGFLRLRRVLADASVPYPASPAAAIATMIALRTRLALRGLALEPRPEAARARAQLARADACWSAGLGHAWIDPIRAAAFQSRYMMLALDTGDPVRVARGLATEASQLAATGGDERIRRARAIMKRATDMTDAVGDREGRAFAFLMDGSVEFYASRWESSVALCARAERLLTDWRSRSEWELMSCHALSLASLAYLGQLRALRARQAELLESARERGNRLAAICLASGVVNLRWLADDDPNEAQRRADESLQPWRTDDFRFPQYLHLLACVNIALYRGDARAAWNRISTHWPRIKTSMTLQVQNFRVTLRHLRARCALALATSTDEGRPSRPGREALLFVARRDARLIAREDVLWAPALALSLEGGLSAASKDVTGARAHLESAAGAYRAVDMHLHAAAADHERSRLLGADAGRTLLRRAETWMIDENVVRSERLAALLVPGISEGRSPAAR